MTTPTAFDALVDAVAARVLEQMSQVKPTEARTLTYKQAGERLGGKSASSVRGMVNSGTIPSEIVKRISPRLVLLDKIEFDKWLDAQ